jgi:hypothetical protein
MRLSIAKTKAAIVVNGQKPAATLRRVHHPPRLFQRHRQRLFAKDMAACRKCFQGGFHVQMIWRRHQNNLWLFVFQKRLDIRAETRPPLRDSPRMRIIGIIDGDKFRMFRLANGIRVASANEPTPDNGSPQALAFPAHRHLSLSFF